MDTRQTYPDRESAHEIHGGNLTESAKNIWWTNVDVQLVMFLRKWKLALFLLDRMEEDKARRCKKNPHQGENRAERCWTPQQQQRISPWYISALGGKLCVDKTRISYIEQYVHILHDMQCSVVIWMINIYILQYCPSVHVNSHHQSTHKSTAKNLSIVGLRKLQQTKNTILYIMLGFSKRKKLLELVSPLMATQKKSQSSWVRGRPHWKITSK